MKKSMDSFDLTAAKYGLTSERLDKISAELYSILAAYEVNEVAAVADLIEHGTSPRMNGHNQGAGK